MDKTSFDFRCSKKVFDMLKVSNENPASADEFLPCLIYLVLKANPPRIQSNINFITRYRHTRFKEVAFLILRPPAKWLASDVTMHFGDKREVYLLGGECPGIWDNKREYAKGKKSIGLRMKYGHANLLIRFALIQTEGAAYSNFHVLKKHKYTTREHL